eukprot:gene17678-9333_t
MEATTLSDLNGIRSTAGRIVGTAYPSLRTSRIKQSKGRALSGSWTHVRRALANDKLYSERTKSTTEWFDVWDSSQRCRFFLSLLRRCTAMELAYIEGWFIQRSPILRQDFTTVLPRWISLYIFSFLDPKSLCQVAQVCWHWHFLGEQDAVWMPKCVRLGWLLPVFPNKKEYGAWKLHYIRCIQSLDHKVSAYHVRGPANSQNMISIEDSVVFQNDHYENDSEYEYEDQTDLKDSAIVHDSPRPQWQTTGKNPGLFEKDFLSTLSTSMTNRPRPPDSNNNEGGHQRSRSVPADFTRPVTLKFGRQLMRGKTDDKGNSYSQKDLSLKRRSFAEFSKKNTQKDTRIENHSVERRLKQTAGSLYQTRRALESKAFHVSTMDDSKIRNDFLYDQPVVLFISSRMPSKELLLDCTLFGIVAILYDYEGTTLEDLITKLKLRLCGRFARCIGFCVDGDKTQGTARIVEGTTLSLSTLKHPQMQEFWRELCTRIADSKEACVDIFWPLAASENGTELMEELSRITGTPFSCPAGYDGSLTRMETEWINSTGRGKPQEKYFKSNRIMLWTNHCEYLEETMRSLRSLLRSHLYQEYSGIINRMIGNLAGKLMKIADVIEVEKLCGVLSSVCTSEFHLLSEEETNNRLRAITRMISEQSESGGEKSDGMNINEDPGASQVEQRTQCAFAIYQTECQYRDKLQILKNVYFKPLASCVQSNRAIISNNSVKMIFSDCDALERISSQLAIDLKKRLDSWNSEQCLGDVYLSFSTNLKGYSNFLKNYPTILKTIERCIEETPSFRAFLDRQKKAMESRQLRFTAYSFAILHSANLKRSAGKYLKTECSRAVIAANENKFKAEERVEREERFKELQSRIKGCPPLTQQGRIFLREMELSELLALKGNEDDDNRSAYIHVREVTIFLFNDIILVAKRLTRLNAFKRSTRQELR